MVSNDEKRLRDLEAERKKVSESTFDPTGFEGAKLEKARRQFSRSRSNRIERIDANIQRVRLRVEAEQRAAQRGTTAADELKGLKRKKFRREAASLRGERRERFERQRREVRASAAVSIARRRGLRPREEDIATIRERERRLASEIALGTRAGGTLSPAGARQVSRFRRGRERISEVIARREAPREIDSSANITLLSGRQGFTPAPRQPMMSRLPAEQDLLFTPAPLRGARGITPETPAPPRRTQVVGQFFEGARRGLFLTPNTFRSVGRAGGIEQALSDIGGVTGVGGAIATLGSTGSGVLSRIGTANRNIPIVRATTQFLQRTPSGTAVQSIVESTGAGVRTAGVGRVIERERRREALARAGISQEEFSGIISRGIQASAPESGGGVQGFFRNVGFSINPAFGSRKRFEEQIGRELTEREVFATDRRLLTETALSSRRTRSLSEAAAILDINRVTEKIGRSSVAQRFVSLPSNIQRVPKTRAFSRVASASASRIGQAGVGEGVGGVITQDFTRGTRASPTEIAVGGIVGGATAGILGGAIPGLQAAGAPRASRTLERAVNVLDPFEKPGDFLADVGEGIARRSGRTVRSPGIFTTSRDVTLGTITDTPRARTRTVSRTGARSGRVSPSTRTIIPSFVPSPTPAPVPAPTPAPVPSFVPSPTPAPVPAPTPISTFPLIPSVTPTPTPSITPTGIFSNVPVAVPFPRAPPFFVGDAPRRPRGGGVGARGVGRGFGVSSSLFAQVFRIRSPKRISTPAGGFTGLELRPLVGAPPRRPARRKKASRKTSKKKSRKVRRKR